MQETGQRVVIVAGRPEREDRINQKIKSAVTRFSPNTEVYLLDYHDPELVMKIVDINPYAIVTFPFTAITTSYKFYILKYLLNCHLICFRTEGILPTTGTGSVKSMVGLEKYGVNFVDYEIFWGAESARLAGKLLLEQKKLSSPDRIKYFGYPSFEDYLRPDCEFDEMIPDHIKAKLKQHSREKTFLFVTCFSLADYSNEDLVNAGDLVDKSSDRFQKDFTEAQTAVKEYKQCRQMWIDNIIASAVDNPEVLFIVKTHPSEIVHYRKIKSDPYYAFKNYDNIVLVTEPIPFRALISHASLLFHYGSTTMLESYLAKVPSVFVGSNSLKKLEGSKYAFSPETFTVPSTISADITDTPAIVSRHLAGPIQFDRNTEVENYLEKQLNFKVGQDYNPSEKIARFLLSLSQEDFQPISGNDKYLINSFQQSNGPALINILLGAAIEKFNSGDWQLALTVYLDGALKLAGITQLHIAKLQYLRACCFCKMGLIDEAFTAIRQELKINPDDNSAKELYCQLQASLAKKKTDDVQDPKDFDRLIPRIFAVETVLGCDLHCPECALGGGFITRKKGMITFEQFKIIADKIQPFCEYLYLHIWGEPLLNNDIFKMIEYASAFTKTNISTNGKALTEEKAKKLISSGVTDILVSIDGVSQEIYEQYRVGGSSDKAFSALKILQRLNLEYGNKVNIIPQFIVFKHNQHEMKAFCEFCSSIALQPSFKAPYIRANSRYQNSDNPQYVRPSYPDIESLKQAMSKNCKNPREVFTILLDGSCVMCCYDHNGVTNYGNIYSQDVMDIWNSPKYRKDRLDIITGKAPKYCVDHCLGWTLRPPQTNAAKVEGYGATQVNKNSHLEIITSETSGRSLQNFALLSTTRKHWGRRHHEHYDVNDGQNLLEQARKTFQKGCFNEAFDIYEQLSIAYPNNAVEILAEVYDQYQRLPGRDRYTLYQSRIYDFGLSPNDKVSDIGSGHIPFPNATHLADIALTDNSYGRAGAPFKYIDGKPVFECDVENLPFRDKEFDFVYCSHVLEHTINPEKACDELMRVAKRGYIETPTPAKDIWLNSTKISNHKWAVENINNKLIFTEHTPKEIEGLGNGILLNMHCSPQTDREKAFSALIYLKANVINTMMLWEETFEYEVRRLNQQSNSLQKHDCCENNKPVMKNISKQPGIIEGRPLSKIPTAPAFKTDIPLKIQVIGSEYGSCAVILDLIPFGSTIISAGVGEDIVFDLELIRLKNCKIIGVDPTEKARRYVENHKHERFCFLQKALYSESNRKVKIYKNTNPDYVSESIISSHNMVSVSDFYEAETITIYDLLGEYESISVLKLDIEGAEYEVLDSLTELEIPQVYTEFHHFCTGFVAADTERCIEHMNQLGYVIAYGKSQSGTLKDVTFVHKKYVPQKYISAMNIKELAAIR